MRQRVLASLAAMVVVVGGIVAWNHRLGVPEDFADHEAQFKYGSIGTDHPMTRAPIPYWIWKVLPIMFTPSAVIKPGFGPANDLSSYAAFGLISETDMPRPRGFSPGNCRPGG